MAFIESICPECGAKILVNDEMESCFCMACGKKILVVKTQDGGRKADADALMTRADSFFSNKEYYKASQYYDQVLDIFPSHLGALKGIILSRLEWDEFNIDTVPQCKMLLKSQDLVHALDTADDEGRTFFTELKEKAEKKVTDYRLEKEAVIRERRAELLPFSDLLVSNEKALFGLRADGTVAYHLLEGDDKYDYKDILKWNGIVQIAADMHYLYGVRYNGDVVYCGSTSTQVLPWKNVISIDTARWLMCAVTKDGHVYVKGSILSKSEEELQREVDAWTDIKKACILGDNKGIAGIDGEGRLYIAGGPANPYKDYTGITDVFMDSTGDILCITDDGHVLIPESSNYAKENRIIRSWDNAVSLMDGYPYLTVVKSDGTMDTTKNTPVWYPRDISSATDVVFTKEHLLTILLLCDDYVVRSIDVSGDRKESFHIPDAVGIFTSKEGRIAMLAIKKDGTICTDTMDGIWKRELDEHIKDWKLFDDYKTFNEERQRAIDKLSSVETERRPRKVTRIAELEKEREELQKELDKTNIIFQSSKYNRIKAQLDQKGAEWAALTDYWG